MCGICGIYEYKTQRPVDQQILDDMLQVLHHRGPDDAGSFLDRDLSMGMRRLSIIDLNGGKQPISNEDGTVVTVFNGEIYNYQLMRGHLEASSSATRMAWKYADIGTCLLPIIMMAIFGKKNTPSDWKP